MLSGAEDGSIVLTRVGRGDLVASLPEAHIDSIEGIAFCDAMPWAVSGATDGRLCIWNVSPFSLRQAIDVGSPITTVKWCQNSTIITVASVDAGIRQYDGRNGNLLHHWLGHEDAVLCFAISDDSAFLVSGSEDTQCLVFAP